MNLSKKEKEKIIKELVKAGAIRREKPLEPGDPYYSKSLGKKGMPTPKIWTY